MTTGSVKGAARTQAPTAGTATAMPPARAATTWRGAARPNRRRRRNGPQVYIVVMALAVVFVGPFAWLVLAAVKTQAEWAAVPPRILPADPQWTNFVRAFTDINFPAYMANSLFLSTIFAVLVTLSSATVGFGFARLRGWGKGPLFVIVLSTMMLPQILTLIPTYMLFAKVGLINTYWPWVLWGLGAAPFLVFLFRQFFAAIPAELEYAAFVGLPGELVVVSQVE